MALITFFSAKGAPGVTSTAMLTAALWPRQTLLVDADGGGGDLLMRLPNEQGVALTQHPGLLTLLPLARHGLAPGVVLDHSQVVHGGQRVLVGLESAEQADAASNLWPTLARAFRELPDADVIVDAGQLTARSGQLALAQRSDIVVGVVRPTPASVMHMRDRLAVLTQTFAALGAEAPLIGLVTIAGVQHQQEAASAVATSRGDLQGVLDLGQVALDPRAERMFHGEPVARPERTMLVRSGRTLVEHLMTALAPRRPVPVHDAATQDGATDGIPPGDGTSEGAPDAGGPDQTPDAGIPADGIPPSPRTPGTDGAPDVDGAPDADDAPDQTRGDGKRPRKKWRMTR